MNPTTTLASSTSISSIFNNLVPTSAKALNFDFQHVLFNLALAFVLALVIALVYKKNHRGLSYSQGFVMTLILAGMVITAVMMIIGSNVARAFGAFGAFSLIRFRTAIKDTRDMAYVFLVLAVGMAIGTENYIIGVVLTAVALVVMTVLTRMNFGSVRKYDYVLSFHYDTRTGNEQLYKGLFDRFLKFHEVLYIKAREQGQVLLLSYSVRFITEKDFAAFVSELQRVQGITEVNLIAAKNDIEY